MLGPACHDQQDARVGALRNEARQDLLTFRVHPVHVLGHQGERSCGADCLEQLADGVLDAPATVGRAQHLPFAIVHAEVMQRGDRVQQVVLCMGAQDRADLLERGAGVVARFECEAAGEHVEDDAIALVAVRQRLAVEHQPVAGIVLQRLLQQARLAAASVTQDADDASLAFEHLLADVGDDRQLAVAPYQTGRRLVVDGQQVLAPRQSGDEFVKFHLRGKAPDLGAARGRAA